MNERSLALNKFCHNFDTTQIKIETKLSGLEFLAKLTSQATLDYVEFKKNIHKYRLSQIPPTLFTDLIEKHINCRLNLCVYFAKQRSNKLALNFDQAKRHTVDVKISALIATSLLSQLDLSPLLIYSGRGYHLWCTFNRDIANEDLVRFLQNIKSIIAYEVKIRGGNPENVNLTCYPGIDTGKNSLRLFGSNHVKTGRFSSIVTQIAVDDVMLNANDSWNYFTNYINTKVTLTNTFDKAAAQLETYINHISLKIH